MCTGAVARQFQFQEDSQQSDSGPDPACASNTDDEGEAPAEGSDADVEGDDAGGGDGKTLTRPPPSDQFSSMSVKELKAACGERKLAQYGSKHVLIERLRAPIGAGGGAVRKRGKRATSEVKLLQVEKKSLIIVLDIETTANGPYSSDIIQLAAMAVSFPDRELNIQKPDFNFNMFCKTKQKIGWVMAKKPGFRQVFSDSVLNSSPSFPHQIGLFFDWISELNAALTPEQLFLAGHKINSSDLLCLQHQCESLGIPFEDKLKEVGVVGCIDTFVLAKGIPALAALPKLGLEELHLSLLEKDIKSASTFHAHDARGDVHANAALLFVPAFRDAISSRPVAQHLADVTMNIQTLRAAHAREVAAAKAKAKPIKRPADVGQCSAHGVLSCRVTAETNFRHAGRSYRACRVNGCKGFAFSWCDQAPEHACPNLPSGSLSSSSASSGTNVHVSLSSSSASSCTNASLSSSSASSGTNASLSSSASGGTNASLSRAAASSGISASLSSSTASSGTIASLISSSGTIASLSSSSGSIASLSTSAATSTILGTKRPRGRPRKSESAPAPAAAHSGGLAVGPLEILTVDAAMGAVSRLCEYPECTSADGDPAVATIACLECQEAYCASCSSTVHNSGSRLRHTRTELVLVQPKAEEQDRYSGDSGHDSSEEDIPPGLLADSESSECENDEGEHEEWLEVDMDSDEVPLVNEPTSGWRPVEDHKSVPQSKMGARGFYPDATIGYIFKALLGGLIMLSVVMTNLYARQNNRSGWRDTSTLEMTAFFGLILYFGRKQLSRTDAWRDFPWGDPFAQQIFPKTRFDALYACWHLVDNTKVSDKEKKANAFWQVWPLITTLGVTFLQHFSPGFELSIDEMTTPFKGKSRAKQYNPAKPNKWGFKDFALCCARTGYCLVFHPYQGPSSITQIIIISSTDRHR